MDSRQAGMTRSRDSSFGCLSLGI